MGTLDWEVDNNCRARVPKQTWADLIRQFTRPKHDSRNSGDRNHVDQLADRMIFREFSSI